MAVAAKAAMKGSVDGRGVSWDGTVAAMRADGDALEALRAKFAAQPPGDAYPSYYLVPFHAYAEGNLNWLASFEVEPASYAMAIRTFKDQPELSAAAALAKLRAGITGALAVRVVCWFVLVCVFDKKLRAMCWGQRLLLSSPPTPLPTPQKHKQTQKKQRITTRATTSPRRAASSTSAAARASARARSPTLIRARRASSASTSPPTSSPSPSALSSAFF